VTTTARSGVPLPVGNDSRRRFLSRPTMLLASLMAMLVLVWTYISRPNQPRRWAPLLTMVLVLVLGITLTSCGGGGSGDGGGTVPIGTLAGTYTITVSASAAAGSTTLTHTTKLTLIVQ
jgi:FtsH-binding integral membrane protein